MINRASIVTESYGNCKADLQSQETGHAKKPDYQQREFQRCAAARAAATGGFVVPAPGKPV